jgi:hypothetical protein
MLLLLISGIMPPGLLKITLKFEGFGKKISGYCLYPYREALTAGHPVQAGQPARQLPN